MSSINKKQVEKWCETGIISREQADKILADITSYKQEQSSNNLVMTISTIGSVLLGIGAILFIASNWQEIPNILKTLLLVACTLGAYGLGYYFKYVKGNLPRVGASLIFLGALLFGASVFLIAQIYNVNANNHVLLLIWMIGILPFVYVFQSAPIALLTAILFFVWMAFFIFRGVNPNPPEGDFLRLPVLYLISGLLLFSVGTLHYLSSKLHSIARVFRLLAITVSVASLFLLTFRFFSGFMDSYFFRSRALEVSDQFMSGLVLMAVLAIIASVISLFFNPSKSETNKLESGLSLGILALSLIFFFYPAQNNLYTIIFNLVLVAIIITLIFIGYRREDIKLVNTGIFWISAFIIVRYFDFFWDLLPRSLFFFVGGLVLVIGGIAIERQRRQLKSKFSKPIISN
jgi:uncharacterized membrane protein